MAEPSLKKRIWGWYFFDWASQPYHTLLVTFIFAPYFASLALESYLSSGLPEEEAKASAQQLWARCLALAGVTIGITAPFLGALADTAGRRMPYIIVFSIMTFFGAFGLWWTDPGATNLWWPLMAFAIGFIGVEYALIFANAQLPSLGTKDEIGQHSGSAFAFGYLGGVTALAIALLLLVAQDNGKTLLGIAPLFGLDPANDEGTRLVGPFVAVWYAVFMIPYFLWVREARTANANASFSGALSQLWGTVKGVARRGSLASFLGSSLLYRDGLNGLYAFGGIYAQLVLEWSIVQVGIFGIIAAVAAAAFTWVGGKIDRSVGPKPVIVWSIIGLIIVCIVAVSMDRTMIFGIPLAEDSFVPDLTFYICGIFIGGLGGTIQGASRTMMVRHSEPGAETEAFGIYGLTGKTTAFLAPLLVGIVTGLTGSVRLGISPIIVLFILGLVLLRWVHPDGDRAASWSAEPSPRS